MDVRRAFWSLFAGIGLLLWVQILAGLTADTTVLQATLAAMRGLVFVAVVGYAVVEPDRLGGPTGPPPVRGERRRDRGGAPGAVSRPVRRQIAR